MGQRESSLGWRSSRVLAAVLLTGCSGDSDTPTGTAPPPPPVPTSVSVSPATAELTALGATVQLSAEVRDQNGQAIAGATVVWSSSDALVATVAGSGLVTAVNSGTATITATAGAVSGEARVRVTQSAASVVVSPAADTLARGDTLRLVAEAFDENGHRVIGAEFTWSSSIGSVATVDASGLERVVADGTVTITAMAGEVSGTSEITIENPDRAALVALYEATGGPTWTNNDGLK